VMTVKADAASYGSPSSRPRIFYIAARLGVPLPRFPVPTHTNKRFQAPGMTEASRNMFGRSAGSALLPGWTARDAISDLPGETLLEIHLSNV
jgi:DNA (cytosine-5)-methyltransferase 1